MKKGARNKQIVFFAESRKTVKLKLFLEKAQKGHSGEFLDMGIVFFTGSFSQNEHIFPYVFSSNAQLK